MEENLQKIDHFVVLMLENRSFDNMLGWLYDPGNSPPYDKVPRGQAFSGLSGRRLSNPVPRGTDGGARADVPVGKSVMLGQPDPDPGEAFERVNVQLYGTAAVPDPPPIPAPMSGFVRDYITALRERGIRPTYPRYRQIMDAYTPAQLPALSALANSYAVCDEWFCAVPTMTLPNRSFFHAGTSGGRVLNTPYAAWRTNVAQTVFNRLEDAGRPWTVYYDEANVLPLTLLLHYDRLKRYFPAHFRGMDSFFRDCARGVLPSYAFLEPRFFVRPNDQHPPHGVAAGDELVRTVYEAVRGGPAWQRTLLCITYDEHGGCYDHVPPPPAVPPGDGAVCPQGFRFDRMGLRVPTVLISPWIEAGTVFRAAQPLDHTSMIRTVCRRWGLAPITDRDRAAPDLGGVLTRAEPRQDTPRVAGTGGRTCPARWNWRLSAMRGHLPGKRAASPLHRATVGLAAAHAGLAVREPATVLEALRRLREVAV
ncbi:MAG: alkaline phosphatase family protein, partial [Steroidobacteraceae bacterium]